MSRWISFHPFWTLAGSVAMAAMAAMAAMVAMAAGVAGCSRRDGAVRDAWALWLEHEPTCAAALDPAQVASLSPRWRVALVALADETLDAMEERLAEAGGRGSDGEHQRLLGELVAGSRRLCGLARAGPAAVPVSTVARVRAEVASTRSRLAVVLPLSDEEVRQRTRPYDGRLSNAVSDALEWIVEGPELGGEASAAAETVPRATPRDRERAEPPESGSKREGQPVAGAGQESSALPPAGEEAAVRGDERISIRTAADESWDVIRRRRVETATRRLARWRELYDAGLRPVAELRAELARELRRDSLDGLIELCTRLGRAAERVPRAVIDEAPSARLAADLTAFLEAYGGAGRACAEVRPVLAWQRLVAGDRRWEAARRTAKELAAHPGFPDSLRRESARRRVPVSAGGD